MTTQATAPATPPPVQPAPAAPPTTTASIGERMAIKRRTILAKSPPAPAETGSGGGGEPGGVVSAPAPATAEPANDNAPAAAEPEKPANDNEKKPEPETEAAAAVEKAKQERAERQEAIQLGIQRKKLAQRERQLERRERQYAEQTKREATEKERLETLRKTDRIAYLRETTGKSIRELLEDDLKNEQAEPKVKLDDLPADVRDRLAKIEELEKREKDREERAAKEAEESAKAAGAANAQKVIRATFTDEKDDYPHLATYYDHETVVASAWELVFSHYEETGEELDLRKVFAYMEGNAEKERANWSKPLSAPTRNGGSPNGQTALGKPASPEPVTMSQSDAASGAPAPRKETQAQRRDRIRKRSQSR